MKYGTFLATTAAAVIGASGAMASGVSIDQIGAIWQNPTGSAITGGNFAVDNGDGDPAVGGETVTIFWGSPTTTQGGRSGYSFNPTDVSFPATADSPFALGEFIHFNRPIFESGGDLSTVELNFVFGGTPNLGSFTSFGAIFDFTHDETLNDADECPADSPPCNDLVTVSAVGGASESVRVGQEVYTFTLLGFSPTGVEGSFSNQFSTVEGLNNSSSLWAVYTVAPIPLPAAGWLLVGGLGALGVAARRRRKDA